MGIPEGRINCSVLATKLDILLKLILRRPGKRGIVYKSRLPAKEFMYIIMKIISIK